MSLNLREIIIELMNEAQAIYKGNNWNYVSIELGKRYGIVKTKEAVRAFYRNYIQDRNVKVEPKEVKALPERITIELLKDGSTVSERKIAISEADLKKPNQLLKAHGFDPDEFELVTAKNNYWDSNVGEKEIVTLYQSKITVKPKNSESGLSKEEILEVLNKVEHKDYKFTLKEIKETKTFALEVDIFDAHIGGLSWHKETGEDNDYKLTFERFVKIVQEVKELIEGLPIDKLYLVFGGDFFQIDTEGMTTVKGTKVDFDTRPYKMLQKGYDLVMYIIDELAIVDTEVIWIEGNHSKNLEFAVFNALPHIYKNAKHIKFNVSPRARKIFIYGSNLVGLHHGEMNKANSHSWLQTEYREEWGNSKYAETHSGHIHHESVVEKNGIINRSNPTSKPLDKYEYQEGYTSNKATLCYLWSKDNGLKSIHYIR